MQFQELFNTEMEHRLRHCVLIELFDFRRGCTRSIQEEGNGSMLEVVAEVSVVLNNVRAVAMCLVSKR